MADKNFLTEIIDADLAEGKVSEIHTRFPPEPNGYLHIGSAKAIYINWSIARAYGGKFNLRLDDTNPAREDVEYVNSILEDLHWLGADPDGGVFYGSDYFEQCYEYAEKLIREGKAYVDDLTRDEMREYRGSDAGKPSRPSPWRDRTPEENLDLFRRMRAGEFKEGEKTLRAKIDLASPNMNMRDPAIYRIKYEHHHRQGDKWCIYPMYDFAHPIQDAIEGITHSMCSLEFENHRPLYEWVIENIFGGEFPKQREFARLNMTNTVMSKRYLRELVETGMVDGWDDPRMPTLCGLRRRGYTPTSIFTFVREAGISKADNLIDMRQLEACVRSELDLTAQRRVAVLRPVKLIVDNYPAGRTEDFCLANNPNREACDCSTRNCVFSRELWIEADDFAEVPPPKFKRLTVGGEVRLMGAYIVRCTGVDAPPTSRPAAATPPTAARSRAPSTGSAPPTASRPRCGCTTSCSPARTWAICPRGPATRTSSTRTASPSAPAASWRPPSPTQSRGKSSSSSATASSPPTPNTRGCSTGWSPCGTASSPQSPPTAPRNDPTLMKGGALPLCQNASCATLC